MKKVLPILLFSMLFSAYSFAQRYGSTTLHPKDIKKLSTIELESEGRMFPKSKLFRMHRDSVLLFTDIAQRGETPLYVQKKLSPKGFDYVTVTNRAEKTKFRLIGGAIFGTLGYMITKNVTRKTAAEVPNIGQLGQDGNSGTIESIIGGITGVGFGMLVGEFFASRRMNLKKNQRKALKEIKRFAY